MKRIPEILLTGALPLLLLSACGGGGNDGDSTTPEISSALEGGSDVDEFVSSSVVSGRVADGYLQGATVCVDVNENDSCDPGESSTVTGAAGAYLLDVPLEQAGKPIIASVPADAIDEDTGQAIGKKLLLSTPHDRPGFISPITTLVHEELRSNPTLTTGDAEASVRDELGLANDSTASLFEDYVASQNSDDSEDAARYRFLHQTARVVASMMDDIQDRVELIATDGGLDLTGDLIAQEAIRKLVRQEVRDLLPAISRAVAERINEQSQEEDGATPVSIIEEVDPDTVVEELRPEDLETDVIDKINAIGDEAQIRQVAMETLMKEGIYRFDVDCEESDAYCYADYSHITVTGDDNTFTEERYEFDAESASWVMWEGQRDDEPFALLLKEGEWQTVDDDNVIGSIEFLDDGGALFATGLGKSVVYATAQDLSDKSVKHHLREREAPRSVLAQLDESALFPSDSIAHHLHIKRHTEAHVLFNWAPDDSDENSNRCETFGGNCNYLDTSDESGTAPIVTLNEVLEGSTQGIKIAGLIQHQFLGQALNVTLTTETADGAPDGENPAKGKVIWHLGKADHQEIYPVPGECEPQVEMPSDDEPATQPADSGELGGIPDSGSQEPPCEHPVILPFEGCPDRVDQPVTEGPELVLDDECLENQQPVIVADDAAIDNQVPEAVGDLPDADQRAFAYSHWKTINVQGVTMIEVGLPIAVKHSIDIEEAGSLLLIEQDGYVRRGAKLSDAAVSEELTYSLPAFETLEPIIKSYITR